MTRTRIVSLLAAVAAALLLGCGARITVPAASASTVNAPAAANTAPSATSPTSPSPAPPAADAARETTPPRPTATPVASGAPFASIIPQPSAPLPPRGDRRGFLVALDPGHGGDESGAAAHDVVERDSNLDLARRVGAFLEAAGVQVHYTRRDDGRAPGVIPGGTGGNSSTRNDLQARVAAANQAGADVFVSLHSNGSGDPSMRGVEVYYESRRPFADQNYRLAQHLLDGALRGLANAGHPSPNRGIIDAACWRNFSGRCVGLFVLSPGGITTGASGTPGPTVKQATDMPAALLETLFVSSPDDAALLKNDAVRTTVARGIADGILRYLGVSA